MRNSSFELLRIILILMILVEHANMWFIGSGYHSEPEHLAKCMVESVCIGGVNAFVLISGWFGMRGDLKKIGDLMFMLLFCTVPLLLVALWLKWIPLSALASADGVYEYVFGGAGYWFVVDYIGLLIISPVLNYGIERLDKRQFRRILLAGYALILLYDFVLREPVLGSEGGYSVLWFGFLYLLARYMRSYGMGRIMRFRWPILIMAVALQSLLFFGGFIGLRYTNPLILLEAVCLIFIFRNWNFHSKAINTVAAGVLMAYLLHMQPVLIPYIRRFLGAQYAALGYWQYMLQAVALSVAVLFVAVLFDKVQSTLLKKIRECL